LIAGGTYVRFDHDLGWVTADDAEGQDGSVVYRTNEGGQRAEQNYALDPPAGVRRLAAFGDSFTHCDEVAYSDCWTAQLEKDWSGIEVMNFGVPGYGIDQAWLRYQRDGQPYQPCAVLIGYFVEDIDRVVNRFRPFIDPADSVVMSKPRFLLDGDGLRLLPNPTNDPMELDDPKEVERLLADHDTWYFPGTFVEGPFDEVGLVRIARSAAYRQSRAALARTDAGYPFYDQQGEAFQVTGRVLIQFAEQVRSDAATPAVIVFTGRRDLLANERG
jgi:hypothetical protein